MSKETETGTQEPEVNVEELKSKIATLEQEKQNLVGELKEDRQKRQELSDEIKLLQETVTDATKKATEKNSNNTQDVESLVEEAVTRALSQGEASKAEGNKKAAFEKFISEHKEFSEDNDITGKRREALEAEFNSFRTDGIVEVDDFYKLIKKAHGLLGDNTQLEHSKNEVQNPYSSIPNTTITPKAEESTSINDLEKKLIEQNGMSEERFLKLKEKNPAFIAQLLEHVK